MPPDITRSRPTKSLLDVLLEACAYAHVHGIPVRIGETGVHCVSGEHPCWARAPSADGVCPIGAAILKAQPETTSHPEAAARALEVHIAVSEGLQDGLNLEPRSERWVQTKRAPLYLYGYEMGVNFRIALLSRRCQVHGAYPMEFSRCPDCATVAADDFEDSTVRGHS